MLRVDFQSTSVSSPKGMAMNMETMMVERVHEGLELRCEDDVDGGQRQHEGDEEVRERLLEELAAAGPRDAVLGRQALGGHRREGLAEGLGGEASGRGWR